MHLIRQPSPLSLRAASATAPRLVSVATAVPEHRIDQANVKAFARAFFRGALGEQSSRLLEVFDHSGIESRNICMPLEWYESEHGFGETNALYVQHGLSLAGEAASRALGVAGLAAREVDHVVFVSSTGIATPSLDARLANLLGFRSDVRRTPIWGLGCAGGAAGMSLARDFALADPRTRVLLVALELCTLTFQRADRDRRNLVAISLFSDGAAAAVVCGASAPPPAGDPDQAPATNGTAARPRSPRSPTAPGAPLPGGATPTRCSIRLLASRSTLWPDTLDVMGWSVDERGLHVIFSRDIPSIVRRWVRPALEDFLHQQQRELGDLAQVIAHPGGPKVLAAYAEALGLPLTAFQHAGQVLRTCGNMSSPTCLFVLERVLAHQGLAPGDCAVLAALGPGFASEYVLMQGA